MIDWHASLAQATPADGPSSDTAAPAEGGETTTGQPGAPPGNPPAKAPGNPLAHPLFGLGLFFIVLYTVLILGRGKKQKRFDKMLQNIKKNDRIVTIGGIMGTVVSTRDDEVVVKVDESNNTKMTFVRKAIQRVLSEEEAKPT